MPSISPPLALQSARTQVSLGYGLLRFAFGLRRFVDQPISLPQAESIIRRGMQEREAALLRQVQRAIFAFPRSPYRRLLQAAGCEFGDVQALVQREGVEGALQKLLEAGVYVSFEEFKGRAPAVRGSQTFTFRDSDFDNPLIRPHFQTTSGGSRGAATRIQIELDHIAQQAPHWAIWFAAHDVLTSPILFITPYYPGIVSRQLLCAKLGSRPVRWFSTGGGGPLLYRLVSAYIHGLAHRLAGFPRPEPVPLDRVGETAAVLAALARSGQRPAVITAPSTAARISLFAQERGWSLQDVTFMLGAEPFTEARKATIEASAARAIPTYGFSEGGSLGSQCPRPSAADDVHVSLDAYAVIQDARSAVPAESAPILLSGFRPACPKVLLNAAIGDAAVLETRRCGCQFDDLGYNQHLHTIRSLHKLTGEGVTFAGADIFHLLEDILPRQFGGTLADYQLLEEQDPKGLPRYTLLVSPTVGSIDEQALLAAFFEELSKTRRHYRFMAEQWAQTGAVRVKRQAPIPTARGKLVPFRTLGPG